MQSEVVITNRKTGLIFNQYILDSLVNLSWHIINTRSSRRGTDHILGWGPMFVILRPTFCTSFAHASVCTYYEFPRSRKITYKYVLKLHRAPHQTSCNPSVACSAAYTCICTYYKFPFSGKKYTNMY